MIEFYLSIRLGRHDRRSLLDAFDFVAAWARAERGCLGVDLYFAASDSCRLCYVERWKSEDELRSMLRSRHFSHLIALTELAYEFVGCEFKVIHEIRGLEFAAEVLGETALPQLVEHDVRKNL
ncbi:MAG: antibiotic biosynthesis monooxygenase [Methylicorpusculum sp.]|uniref:putative quinol monooxygenase n=1 Tax=Methylicorpusculum sp. TaxID=2713644 RepID=UPI0027238FB5|nr:antibiotic biosynthesis monooxygenase [Methylicorpusculum sp.]MDO8846146.1 antibiotic biosynthesis monooxygenase [Methylicorpusculum sp.]MDO8940336.1 antibiotic biosynthesis monooxygenase [Methylicorpusculum sp.]MDP2203793.1 antibiotic biosynthesis monooxygenase [Methylicorpusculum sp.]